LASPAAISPAIAEKERLVANSTHIAFIKKNSYNEHTTALNRV
jgi:hypothetical protein